MQTNTYILTGTPVNFTNASTLDNVLSYEWDFGDGGTSIQENPSHIYNTSGDYDVSLIVHTSSGDFFKNKTSYVHVMDESSGEVSCSYSGLPQIGSSISVTAEYSGYNDPDYTYEFVFDYGDGTTETYTDNSPMASSEHVYYNSGNYQLKTFLTVYDNV